MSCGVGRRRGLDPKLWLWCRLAAVAPMRPLAWELPCAQDLARKRKTTGLNEDSVIRLEFSSMVIC